MAGNEPLKPHEKHALLLELHGPMPKKKKREFNKELGVLIKKWRLRMKHRMRGPKR